MLKDSPRIAAQEFQGIRGKIKPGYQHDGWLDRV